MADVTVINHITLDGVMQAPASAEEDLRDGFGHGGWAAPYGDEVMAKAMAPGLAREGAMLFGRRTYEQFFAVWPNRRDGSPFTDVLNRRQKYVASRTLSEPLPWENSTLLRGDGAEAVATLKRDLDQDLAILGSGELVQSLMAGDLIDRYLLTIYPLVLGTGRRLFRDAGAYAALSLVDVTPTTTGVLIATYERRR